MHKKSFLSVLAERVRWAWVRCPGSVAPHSHPSTPALSSFVSAAPDAESRPFLSSPNLQGAPARHWSRRARPLPQKAGTCSRLVGRSPAAHLPPGSLPGIRTSFVLIFDLPTQAHFVELGTEGILRPMQRALGNRNHFTRQD